MDDGQGLLQVPLVDLSTGREELHGLDRQTMRIPHPVLGLSALSDSPAPRLKHGQQSFLEHCLARVRPVDHVSIPEPVQVGLAAIELDDHVIPAPVVRDGVEGLVEIHHEVHDPLGRVLADGPTLGGIVEQPEELLDGRKPTAPTAIALGVVT